MLALWLQPVAGLHGCQHPLRTAKCTVGDPLRNGEAAYAARFGKCR